MVCTITVPFVCPYLQFICYIYADFCVCYDMFRSLRHCFVIPGPHQAVFLVDRQAFS